MDNDVRNGVLERDKFNTIDISGRWWTTCPQFRKQRNHTLNRCNEFLFGAAGFR
jgi:hypothetical protein